MSKFAQSDRNGGNFLSKLYAGFRSALDHHEGVITVIRSDGDQTVIVHGLITVVAFGGL